MAHLVQQAIVDRCRVEDISTYALAKKIGISANQLMALRRGDDVPSLYNLKKLAKFFDWTTVEIGEYVLKCRAQPTGPRKLRGKS